MTVEKIKKLRDLLEMNQQEFANILGVSLSSVANWESGRRFPSRLALQSVNDLMTVKGLLEKDL